MPSDILDLETLHTPEVKENAIETSRKSRKMFCEYFIWPFHNKYDFYRR